MTTYGLFEQASKGDITQYRPELTMSPHASMLHSHQKERGTKVLHCSPSISRGQNSGAFRRV
ncbi:BQ5605_C025g10041 [Microbotryum silenes-dioicae]|uniref:BQ5605_C025g10041 protein n=1 Tax=Microbotryum silenes-dioicae TaxID=796604 RepID=A0A2X0PML3_9BASI|nr:BQ5605_C025g10041 [Microbotryum silenes-dioicae]